MGKIFRWLASLIVILLILLIGLYLVRLTSFMDQSLSSTPPTEKAIEKKLAKEKLGWKNLHFDLVDPEEAPPEIKDLVMRGYSIMLHTHQELPNNARDLLSCTNCHFAGGISTGGTGGGISLAGVAAKYPAYNGATGEVESLEMRLNNCFTNSMSGKPLPLDSKEMLALVTYLHWISSEYPIYVASPWLGLKPLKTKHQPDSANGKKIYEVHCATCHGPHGQGGNLSKEHPGVSFPPLWGPESFNTSAGMNRLSILSSFVYHNMPYDEPHLSAEDSLDVAAFIIQQPRPERQTR